MLTYADAVLVQRGMSKLDQRFTMIEHDVKIWNELKSFHNSMQVRVCMKFVCV
jgi:hypothetical protein